MNDQLVSRPKGITFLAWLHIIGSILIFVMMIILPLTTGKDPEFAQALSKIGISIALLYIGIVIIFALGILSGVGMMKGKKWGWYIGTTYYIYGIFRNLNALLMISGIFESASAEEIANMSRGVEYYYVKHSIRILINLLIYLYFFKRNVREYFRLAESPKWKPIVFEIIGCLMIFFIVSLFSWLI